LVVPLLLFMMMPATSTTFTICEHGGHTKSGANQGCGN
jgi:hypothetical protein